MTFTLSDASSIAGIYLALVSLLSSILLINLSHWLSTISGLLAKWERLNRFRADAQYYEQRMELYVSLKQATSHWTWICWLIVTVFTWAIVCLQFRFQNAVRPEDLSMVKQYVSIPCLAFASVFSTLSLILLFYGYFRAMKVEQEVKETV
jgi:hypothetical protein